LRPEEGDREEGDREEGGGRREEGGGRREEGRERTLREAAGVQFTSSAVPQITNGRG
jgi:hypothetical protein